MVKEICMQFDRELALMMVISNLKLACRESFRTNCRCPVIRSCGWYGERLMFPSRFTNTTYGHHENNFRGLLRTVGLRAH
jgi:hypothetical protein